MQIEKDLPQFANERALIVVSGKQAAALYLAYNSEIEELDSFSVEREKPDDVAGHFETSAGGQTIQAGAAFEPSHYDEKAQREYLKELGEHLKKLTHEHSRDAVYIFAPDYMKNAVSDALPSQIADTVRKVFAGNYTKHHPFKLLEMIQDAEHKDELIDLPPHEGQAQQILHKKDRSNQ